MEALREPGMIHVKAMCIITHKGRALATRGFDHIKNEHFYRLIGGGVHFREVAIDALKREFGEELGVEIANIKFLEVVENIFTYKGTPSHEVIFIYSAELVTSDLFDQEEIPIIDHPSTIAVWVPIDDVLSGKAKLTPALEYAHYLS